MEIGKLSGIQSTPAFSATAKTNAQPKVDMESKDIVEFSTKANTTKNSKSKKIGAGIASFLYPGLGQLVNGEPKKALKYVLGGIGLDTVGTVASLALTTFVNPVAGIAVGLATGLAHLGLNISSIVDAVKTAD